MKWMDSISVHESVISESGMLNSDQNIEPENQTNPGRGDQSTEFLISR